MERGQYRTPNALVHVYKMLAGGVRTIATPTKTNHNGEQNVSIVKVQNGYIRHEKFDDISMIHRYTIPYIIHYDLHNIASVDCKWGAWRDPGACSKSCGGGTRSKIRVKLVEEKNGGQCIGKSIAFELCNMDSCPGNISDHIYLFL